jgi:hypothetical protein
MKRFGAMHSSVGVFVTCTCRPKNGPAKRATLESWRSLVSGLKERMTSRVCGFSFSRIRAAAA